MYFIYVFLKIKNNIIRITLLNESRMASGVLVPADFIFYFPGKI